MPDYQKMYSILFNEVTKTIERLQAAQQKAEDVYLNSPDTPVTFIRDAEKDDDGSKDK